MLLPLETVDVDGYQVAFRRIGSGPTLICLHGFPQTSACWDLVAEQLADRFTLVMPDLPGFGGSDPLPSPDGKAVSKHMARFMDALGLDKATLVCHDFGGAVGWTMALTHPGRLDGLVVVNSPFRKLDLKRGWHMLFFNLPILPELVFMLGQGKVVETMINLGVRGPNDIPEEAMAEYRLAFRSLSAQRNAFAYYRTLTRRFMGNAIRKTLPFVSSPSAAGGQNKVEVPTLVVWGAEDPVLPVSLTDDMHRQVSDFRLEILDGVGHFVPEESPERLAELIGEFVSQ